MLQNTHSSSLIFLIGDGNNSTDGPAVSVLSLISIVINKLWNKIKINKKNKVTIKCLC